MKIGNVEIKNKIALAPMAGISNPSYMKICEELNAGYAITELISAEAVIRNNQKTFDMLNGIEDINMPVAVQLFGSNPEVLASAAKILTDKYKIKIIDINMGCPVPKVAVKSDSGSAIMKDPNKAYEIVKKVVETVDVPVTVKIRSGWDEFNINAVEIAKLVESAGASAITVHPRTRKQGYSGKSDWNIIKEVKESVSIPVIGNGDIKSCYDAKKMLEETSCDMVMIGRALLGNPWLIKECYDYLEENKEPLFIKEEEKVDMILKHFNYLLKYKCEKLAVLEMRSHAAWYLKGLKGALQVKEKIFKACTKEEFIKIIEDYKKERNFK